MGRLPRAVVAVLLCAGVGVGCGGGGSSGNDDSADANVSDPSPLYDRAITRVTLEIDYESGAAPYAGDLPAFGDIWSIFTANAERLFLDAGKTLDIPTQPDQMEELGAIDDDELEVADLLALADLHRDLVGGADEAVFYILFVDGYYDDGNEVRMDVLGVSIGNTGVIAMFKPVIEGTASPLFPSIEKYVEQSTLVHEFGHAVGLVANGLPTTSDHHDAAHGAHCNSDRCTMYWLNEGASDAVEFARQYVTSSDSILFGSECLADVDAAIAASR